VPRQLHIELDGLLDRDLLSRAVLGIGYEITAPLTIYVPRFISVRGRNRRLWEPLEAFSKENSIVPPRYNQFCEICREAFLNPILDTKSQRR
jgi:hypothetical protein